MDFTVADTLAVLLHPFASVPVTVYNEVEEGFAITDAPVMMIIPKRDSIHRCFRHCSKRSRLPSTKCRRDRKHYDCWQWINSNGYAGNT